MRTRQRGLPVPLSEFPQPRAGDCRVDQPAALPERRFTIAYVDLLGNLERRAVTEVRTSQ